MRRHGLPARLRPGKRMQAERRASVRFAPAQGIICYWSRDGEYVRARVCDISANGVSLLLQGHVEPGMELAVELILGQHTSLCARQVRVARIYPGGGKDLVVVGQFDHELNYDELLPFIL
jgi:PilZ domain